MAKFSFRHLWLSLTFMLGLATVLPACGGLPASVNGQPLPTLAPMLEKATPAVVHIAIQGHETVHPATNDPFFEYFFGRRGRQKRTQGLGSGVIIDASKGYIVTNAHVAEDADTITVTLKDGRRFPAKVIGVDTKADIAVLKINASHLKALPIANSDDLRVGDFVVAIGNPFGLKQTATSGIVSALGRSGLGIEDYENFIQTDASINPGNSGGALVNLRGELVGINTAILGPNGGNIGIGFAIPVNMAISIAKQLIQYGEVQRGRLGVGIQDLTPDLAAAFGLPQSGGAVVSQVEEDSPADQAGLQVGDVVTAVNGKPVSSAARLRNAVGLLRVDSQVTLDILRDGRPKKIVATIKAAERHKIGGQQVTERLAGATFEDVTIDNEPAVVIASVEPGSPAARASLQEGDIILSVNRHRVSSLAELREAAKLNSKALLLNIVRNGRGLFILIQ